MTREEAIWKAFDASGKQHGAVLIDALIALGVLKVEEPRPITQFDRFSDMLQGRFIGGVVPTNGMLLDIVHLMEASGLELVEKKK